MYLEELKGSGIDTLVLGCTHYPLIKECIGRYMGEGITVVNPASLTAATLKTYLERHNLLGESRKGSEPEFYVSDLNQQKFGEISNLAMGKVFEAKKISLDV